MIGVKSIKKEKKRKKKRNEKKKRKILKNTNLSISS